MLSLSRGNEVFSLYKVWKFKITADLSLCTVISAQCWAFTLCVCFQKNRASPPLKSKNSLHLFCHIWKNVWPLFQVILIYGGGLDVSSSASTSWAGNRSVKILPPGPVWEKKEKTIKHNTDICTKSWVPFGYQDFGLGCKPYWECSFLIPGEHPDTWRQKLLTLYSTNHFHSLILVLTRLQPFLWKKQHHQIPHLEICSRRYTWTYFRSLCSLTHFSLKV